MAKAASQPKQQGNLNKQREEWIARVTALVNQISKWAVAEGWKVDRDEKSITEELLGTYKVPSVIVKLKEGEVMLNPIALHTAGGDGRVDLRAMPTLARVKLMWGRGKWEAYADPNVPLRMDWNQANFARLAQDLLS